MSNLKLAWVAAVAAAGIVGVVARGPAASAATPTTMLNRITVTARDFAFQVPDTLAAGPTEIQLVNEGKEMHHVQLIRLDQGKTMADLFAAFKAGGPPPAWSREVGGPNTPVPGGTTSTIVNLTPGRYAMVCFIPSADGMPHIMKGMAKEVTVVPFRAAAATATAIPAVSATITLSDYDFVFSAPLAAGRQAVRVRNAALQPHEVVFVKLAPGETAHDVAAWVEKMDGPPPGAPVGGTTGMAQGEENTVILDLEPGEYAMLCFIPDAKDGKPHIAHGMLKQFAVK